MIGDNYHHVQRWKPIFMAEKAKKAKITSLPVWVRILLLPIEYYSEGWLRRVGNRIGRMIKVDATTLIPSRGKIIRVCVEVDLKKPL